jgi:predicted dehydrogenase
MKKCDIIKLGMIGVSPGNGHPYSFSAIFNGYDEDRMKKCPYPVIYEYLSKQDKKTLCIPGAKITHIWAQDKEEARNIAETVFIEHVVDDYYDLIGEVDAVILARDDAECHLEIATPFLEKGIPIYIDKPLADNMQDTRRFVDLAGDNRLLMSCSATRYSREIEEAREKIGNLGDILTVYAISKKDWLKYGIHLLEAICSILGTNVKSVQNVGQEGEDVVHILYRNGTHVVLQVFQEISPLFQMTLHGSKGHHVITFNDWFYMFRNMLCEFIEMLRTGKRPIPLEETLEIIKILVAGQRSRQEGNKVVQL